MHYQLQRALAGRRNIVVPNSNVFINVQIQGEFVSVGLDLRLILFGFLFSAFKVNDMFLFIKIKNKC